MSFFLGIIQDCDIDEIIKSIKEDDGEEEKEEKLKFLKKCRDIISILD